MCLDFLPSAHILCPKMPLHPQYLSKKSGYHLFLRLHIQCHVLHDTFLKSIFPSLLLKITDFSSWTLCSKIIPLLDGCMHGVISGWLIFLPHLSFLHWYCFHSALKLAPIFNFFASLFSFLFHGPRNSQSWKVITIFGLFQLNYDSFQRIKK